MCNIEFAGIFSLCYSYVIENSVSIMYSDVACEIIDASTMKPVCVLRDHEDEVNIAQFHPVAGNGILYGTKKGKIRKYQRYEQLQHYTDWDDVSSAEYESREESLSDWGDYKI